MITFEFIKVNLFLENKTKHFAIDRVKNSKIPQMDTQTDRQSDFLGFLSKTKTLILNSNCSLFIADKSNTDPIHHCH